MGLVESQARIDDRLDHDGSLAEVEEEIIDPAPYGEERKAALWLYASAMLPRDVAEVIAEAAQQSRSRLSGISTATLAAGKRALARNGTYRSSERSGGAAPRTALAGAESHGLAMTGCQCLRSTRSSEARGTGTRRRSVTTSKGGSDARA